MYILEISVSKNRCLYCLSITAISLKFRELQLTLNGLGHKQKSWVKYTMGGVSYRNFWTSITQVNEIIRGCLFTEL